MAEKKVEKPVEAPEPVEEQESVHVEGTLATPDSIVKATRPLPA